MEKRMETEMGTGRNIGLEGICNLLKRRGFFLIKPATRRFIIGTPFIVVMGGPW